MKVLLTGSNGFIGNHLFRFLSDSKDISLYSFESDITNFSQVYNEIKDKQFDSIIHLAGLSNIPNCEENPEQAFQVNTLGTYNILESLVRLKKKSLFIFASTGQVYASPESFNEEVIIDEQWPIKPRNTYARTKLAAEVLIQNYFDNYELGSSIICRLFNHTHSTQHGDFILPILYREMKKAIQEKQFQPIKLKVGNIEVYRDFGLIADLCDLFHKMLKIKLANKSTVYNVCSGHKRFIQSLANELASQLGISCQYEVDPKKVRANEPLIAVGSCQKAKCDFGWSPSVLSDSEYIKRFLH